MAVKFDFLLKKIRVADTGTQGEPGLGLPEGGTTGQTLVKASNNNYETAWGDAGSGDMAKATYDTDNDGRVDNAENVSDGTNTSSAADVKDAVDKKHTHANAVALAAVSGTNTGDQDLSGKVDKVTGKGLSTEDYTTDEKSKLAGIEASANNYTHPATHSADIITDGTTNKAYTAAEKTKLAGIEASANNYSHPATHSADIITDGTTNKAFTATEKTKLAGIAEGAEVNVQSDWNQSTNTADDYIKNKPTLGNSAAKDVGTGATQVAAGDHGHTGVYEPANANIQSHIGSTSNPHSVTAAQVLPTQTGNNGKYLKTDGTSATWETVTASTAWGNITGTLSSQTDLSTALSGKVDTVVGKGLSANDYTTDEKNKLAGIEASANNYTHPATHSADIITDGTTNKAYTAVEQTKLAGIAAGAEVNVNADWNAVSGDAAILNKPTIPTALSALSDDATHRLVTDSEKTTWNAKQGALTADVDYLTPGTASSTYEPKKGADDNYVTDAEKIVIGNTSGTNTGDQNLSGYFNKSTDDMDDISDGTTYKKFSATEQTKLSGIATGAEVNVNADWNAGSGDAQILNKPTLGDAAAKNTGTTTGTVAAGDHNHTDVYQPVDSDLTTIAGLADPNADRILFWDDSAGAYAYLAASTGLSISTTNMTVRTTSTSQTGIVELATTAETQTGTDTARAVTPAGGAATYAPIAKGVTNGDTHDHSGGDGAQIAYATLSGTPTLGNSASKDVGTGATQVAAGDHNHTGVYAPVLGADDNYVTDAEKTKLANLSGTNSGDQVVPANEAGAANNFLTAYNATTGAFSKAQPTWANINKSTSSIADITTRSHTALTDIGTNTHADIDTALARLANTSGTNTGDQTVPVKASGAEITTGTDDAKFATAKAIKDAGVNTRLKSKVITGTRDLATASGDVSYTGAGFTPTSVIMIGASQGTPKMASFGAADSAKGAYNIASDGTLMNYYVLTTLASFAVNTTGSYVTAAVKSYDSDGLTITWTKNGSPTGTVSFMLLCFS